MTSENAAFPQDADRKADSELYVRLTCKLANALDGIDVTDVRVGDVLDLSGSEGTMLIAEGWAEEVSEDTADESRQPSNSTEQARLKVLRTQR